MNDDLMRTVIVCSTFLLLMVLVISHTLGVSGLDRLFEYVNGWVILIIGYYLGSSSKEKKYE